MFEPEIEPEKDETEPEAKESGYVVAQTEASESDKDFKDLIDLKNVDLSEVFDLETLLDTSDIDAVIQKKKKEEEKLKLTEISQENVTDEIGVEGDSSDVKDVKEALENFLIATKTDVRQSLKKDEFKAVLNIYVTKNNVSWVLTDPTKANLYYKITGGSICKRGTDKDSSKTTIKNFETMIKCCEELKITYLTFSVNTGFGTKKHPKNTKDIVRLLTLFRHPTITSFEEIVKRRAPCVSTVRLKGGRRGRRT